MFILTAGDAGVLSALARVCASVTPHDVLLFTLLRNAQVNQPRVAPTHRDELIVTCVGFIYPSFFSPHEPLTNLCVTGNSVWTWSRGASSAWWTPMKSASRSFTNW